MKIKLGSVQLGLFSPGIIIVNKLKVANDINDKLSNLFDGDPVIVPLAENAPSDFPSLQMNTKNGQYNLTIAKSRLDFYFNDQKEDEKYSLPVPNLNDKILTIFQYFTVNLHTQFTRCAIVTKSIIELEKEAASEHILLTYIREKLPIINPYELQVRYLIKDSIAEFKVNKWVYIKSARKISDPSRNRLIVLEIDINTLAEEEYTLDEQSLQRFLDQSVSNINKVIDNHLKIIAE